RRRPRRSRRDEPVSFPLDEPLSFPLESDLEDLALPLPEPEPSLLSDLEVPDPERRRPRRDEPVSFPLDEPLSFPLESDLEDLAEEEPLPLSFPEPSLLSLLEDDPEEPERRRFKTVLVAPR
ncbi:MAG: hypothetical protein SGARI_001524, partial [Bacillariaceae sp.]